VLYECRVAESDDDDSGAVNARVRVPRGRNASPEHLGFGSGRMTGKPEVILLRA